MPSGPLLDRSIQYLTEKFRPLNPPATPTRIAETLVPVVDAGNIPVGKLVEDTNGNLTGAAGNLVLLFRCPAGYRAHISDLLKGSSTGSSRWGCTLQGRAGVFPITLGTTSATELHGLTLVLLEGDQIGLISTGNVSDAAIAMGVHGHYYLDSRVKPEVVVTA